MRPRCSASLKRRCAHMASAHLTSRRRVCGPCRMRCRHRRRRAAALAVSAAARASASGRQGRRTRGRVARRHTALVACQSAGTSPRGAGRTWGPPQRYRLLTRRLRAPRRQQPQPERRLPSRPYRRLPGLQPSQPLPSTTCGRLLRPGAAPRPQPHPQLLCPRLQRQSQPQRLTGCSLIGNV